MKKLICSAALAALACGFAAPASADQCFGTCGTLGANGVVTAPPTGGSYQYVSTYKGANGVASLDLANGLETTGSLYVSDSFSASPGEILQFYFNYVTSDGGRTSTGSYPDYAWVALRPTNGGDDILLFTARTITGGGDTVPGFNMPALADGVTLSPSTTPIIPGAPTWSPLGVNGVLLGQQGSDGSSSGACWGGVNGGCGYTGWISMEYSFTIANPEMYTLVFGVTNVATLAVPDDTGYQSGLAFAGVTVREGGGGGGATVPEPATMLLFGAGLLGLAGVYQRRKN